MYAPPLFDLADAAAIRGIMRAHPFATLVSTGEGGVPCVTHLPLIHVEDGSANGHLIGHVARPNPHWKLFGEAPTIAIFGGANAYISPTWYESPDMVPTWNYQVVHAHGTPAIVADDTAALDVVVRLSAFFEASLPAGPSTMTPGKALGMMGFTAFDAGRALQAKSRSARTAPGRPARRRRGALARCRQYRHRRPHAGATGGAADYLATNVAIARPAVQAARAEFGHRQPDAPQRVAVRHRPGLDVRAAQRTGVDRELRQQGDAQTRVDHLDQGREAGGLDRARLVAGVEPTDRQRMLAQAMAFGQQQHRLARQVGEIDGGRRQQRMAAGRGEEETVLEAVERGEARQVIGKGEQRDVDRAALELLDQRGGALLDEERLQLRKAPPKARRSLGSR